MRASWERHGATVMDRVAVEYPAAHLVPKEITATIERGGFRRAIARRPGYPARHQRKLCRTPTAARQTEVLAYVRDTLRAADAKLIEPE